MQGILQFYKVVLSGSINVWSLVRWSDYQIRLFVLTCSPLWVIQMITGRFRWFAKVVKLAVNLVYFNRVEEEHLCRVHDSACIGHWGGSAFAPVPLWTHFILSLGLSHKRSNGHWYFSKSVIAPCLYKQNWHSLVTKVIKRFLIPKYSQNLPQTGVFAHVSTLFIQLHTKFHMSLHLSIRTSTPQRQRVMRNVYFVVILPFVSFAADAVELSWGNRNIGATRGNR